jgi:hypothetical protein
MLGCNLSHCHATLLFHSPPVKEKAKEEAKEEAKEKAKEEGVRLRRGSGEETQDVIAVVDGRARSRM